MQIRLVVFDWDGTIADTVNPIVRTFCRTFEDCGLPKPKAEDIRALIGFSLPVIVRRLAPDADERLREILVETYSAHYLNPNNQEMVLFPDVIGCLDALKAQGYWLAVATGKSRAGLARAMVSTADYWLATACADEYASKPAPDMVLGLCDELGVLPQEVLVVGDTVYDLEMAAHAKASAVGVVTGAHTRAQLAQAPHLAILNTLSELPDFLAGLKKAQA